MPYRLEVNYLIIDGNNLFYRGYHTGNMVDREGRKVTGIFNIAKMLNVLLSKFKPHRCIIAWDNGRSARYKLYPEYKAGRRSQMTPEEKANIAWQLKMCRGFLKHLPILQVETENVEADDVIGYLTSRLRGRKLIVTNDRDFLQLVSKGVHVYLPNKARVIHHKNIDSFLGFPHDKFLLSKTIEGDNSDNIKGIPKMGPVRTAKFINSGDPIPEEWRDIIKRNLKLMRIGKILTDDDKENIIKVYRGELRKSINPIRARQIFSNLKFRSMVSRYNAWILPFRRLRHGKSN